MKSFNHFLREKGVPNDVRSLLYHVARAVKYINFSLRAGTTSRLGSQNSSGEDQLAIDVLSDNLIAKELEMSELVALLASEEKEALVKFPAPRGKYVVAYDPLDGSSLMDSNLAIGSIFGIWAGSELVGRKGNELVAACYAIYGPRVSFVIAVRDKGVHEFEMNDVGEFILTRSDMKVAPTSKYFAPGNLRATVDNPKYKQLVCEWMDQKRTLRYSGGMVPDLHHILSKGQGIFTYPRDSKNKNGKLRLSFECAPFAFIFQEAGGIALDQEGKNILDLTVSEPHERTPIFIGSKDDVKYSVDFLKK